MSENPIVLALNQSADTGQCGSCAFFERREFNEWVANGLCRFRLPPTRVFARNVPDAEQQPLQTVNDTDGCDLWRSTGKTYIVSRRLKP